MTAGRGVVAAVLLGLLGGCVVLPIPANKVTHGHQALTRDKQISAVVPGETSRQEVLLRLGEPDGVLDGEQRIYYAWREQYLRLLVALVGPGGSGTGDVVNAYGANYRFMITFDPQGIVSAVEVLEKADFFEAEPD